MTDKQDSIFRDIKGRIVMLKEMIESGIFREMGGMIEDRLIAMEERLGRDLEITIEQIDSLRNMI